MAGRELRKRGIEETDNNLRSSPARNLATWEPETKTPEKQAKLPMNFTRASPTKKLLPRDSKTHDPIQTYIFFDLETSGLFKNDKDRYMSFNNIANLSTSGEFHAALNKYCLETRDNEYPRITEMSFLTIPRQAFERHMKSLHTRNQKDGDVCDLSCYIPVNTHTRQINPGFTCHEWTVYDVDQRNNENIVYEKNDLFVKNTFEKEWPGVVEMLHTVQKPAVLIAHNAIRFDMRVLYGEMKRYKLLESHPIPEKIYFVDSYIAASRIENEYLTSINSLLTQLNFEMFSETLKVMAKPNDENVPDEKNEQTPISPMVFVKKNSWSVAKQRRFRDSNIKVVDSSWKYDRSKKTNGFTVGKLYEDIIGGHFNAHYAQEDSMALLQVCMGYGQDFLNFVDETASVVPF